MAFTHTNTAHALHGRTPVQGTDTTKAADKHLDFHVQQIPEGGVSAPPAAKAPVHAAITTRSLKGISDYQP